MAASQWMSFENMLDILVAARKAYNHYSCWVVEKRARVCNEENICGGVWTRGVRGAE